MSSPLNALFGFQAQLSTAKPGVKVHSFKQQHDVHENDINMLKRVVAGLHIKTQGQYGYKVVTNTFPEKSDYGYY